MSTDITFSGAFGIFETSVACCVHYTEIVVKPGAAQAHIRRVEAVLSYGRLCMGKNIVDLECKIKLYFNIHSIKWIKLTRPWYILICFGVIPPFGAFFDDIVTLRPSRVRRRF